MMLELGRVKADDVYWDASPTLRLHSLGSKGTIEENGVKGSASATVGMRA